MNILSIHDPEIYQLLWEELLLWLTCFIC